MRNKALLVLLSIIISAIAWIGGSVAGYRALQQDALESAERYSQLIANELERFRLLPALMAVHPAMESALRNPGDLDRLAAANNIMFRMAAITGSSDVYLMQPDGLTIGASNINREDTFVGRNFSFRPYFYEVMDQASTASYFALGVTSLERGLYFSYPVVAGHSADPLGVVVAKFLVENLESQWQGPTRVSDAEMVVLDDDGLSFLSSQPDWLYRAFEPLPADARQRLTDNRRYAEEPLTDVDMERNGSPWWISGGNGQQIKFSGPAVKGDFLSVDLPLPELDWRLRVFLSTSSVLWTQVSFLAMTWVAVATLLFTGLYLRERYRREQMLEQRGEELEHKVTERTADLAQTNLHLRAEIDQRRKAQAELEATQQELVQTAKLAVLGQMSAGLNHELNQPLTAIQAYTENSRRFLQRQQAAMVDDNLVEIQALCSKMRDLVHQFKIFARKPEERLQSVDLRDCVDGAVKLVTAQDQAKRMTINWPRPDHACRVRGDLVRLEQVLVNLITNAMHAAADEPEPAIDLSITGGDADGWRLCVRDNGPGLPAETEQLFEPFFTTKSTQQGLGLGLSISRQIAIALDGELTCHNRQTGRGAVFTLSLQKQEQ